MNLNKHPELSSDYHGNMISNTLNDTMNLSVNLLEMFDSSNDKPNDISGENCDSEISNNGQTIQENLPSASNKNINDVQELHSSCQIQDASSDEHETNSIDLVLDPMDSEIEIVSDSINVRDEDTITTDDELWYSSGDNAATGSKGKRKPDTSTEETSNLPKRKTLTFVQNEADHNNNYFDVFNNDSYQQDNAEYAHNEDHAQGHRNINRDI